MGNGKIINNNTMAGQPKDQIRVKLIVLGMSSVGKSSLLVQYVDNEFISLQATTIGVEYKQKIFKLGAKGTVRVQIWDTAGNERYNALTPNYYRQIDGVLIVYDITNQESFDKVKHWIQQLNDKADITKIEMLLVGNKMDLESSRRIKKQAAQDIANQLGIGYVETSAKTFETTRIAFDQLVQKILHKKASIRGSKDKIVLEHKPQEDEQKNNSCC